MQKTPAWILIGALALTSACATRHSLYRDYQATLREGGARAKSRQTTVVIVVDGLGLDVTRAMLKAGGLPRTQKFFDELQSANAVFPTLTYPNIASILTGLGIDEHPITANTIALRNREVNFENPAHAALLNQLLAGKTHFSKYARDGGTSVSFSSSFYEGATAALGQDIKSGLAYIAQNYDYIDKKSIHGLTGLLENAVQERWPEFVFLHIAGYDALAHEHGPVSSNALNYLRWLDTELDSVYSKLAQAERNGHTVRTLMTADHGFDSVKRYYPIEQALRGSGFHIVNQYRLATLHSKGELNTRERRALFSRLASMPEIEAVIEATFSGPRVYAKSKLTTEPSRLIENYFKSPMRPDAVVIAAKGVSFSREGLGQHGGLSPSELEVPILLRGAKFAQAERPSAYAAINALVSLPANAAPTSTISTQEDLGVAQALQVSAPTTQSWFSYETAGQPSTQNSPLSPGFSLDWKQFWDDKISTNLGYGLRFYSFQDETAPSHAHEFRAGAAVRFSSTQTISLIGAYSEVVQRTKTTWVPRVDFGTRKRLWSLGIGDLVIEGALGALVPTDDYSLGFQQVAGAALEAPVGMTHVFRLGISTRHFSQASKVIGNSRSGWELELGAAYEFDL